MVGRAEELVFDGASLRSTGEGSGVSAPVFEETLEFVTVVDGEPQRAESQSKRHSNPRSTGALLGVRDYVGKNGFRELWSASQAGSTRR